MQTDEQIINELMERLIKGVKESLPNVSGKTANSVKGSVDKNKLGFQITGGLQIGALVNGRKPTSAGAKKGSPTLQEMIYDWVKAKSIQPRESSMTQLQLSWAISQSIHKNGYKGDTRLFDDVLNGTSINEAASKFLTNRAFMVQSDILKQFKR